MKRWAWILVFPYLVVGSDEKNVTNYGVTNSSGTMVVNCGQDRDYCEDSARSLNEAHEWLEYDKAHETQNDATVPDDPSGLK